VTGYDLIVDIYLIRLILNKIFFSCNVVWIKWVMGHQYLLESNCCCLWKHVENNLFLSNFMKVSSQQQKNERTSQCQQILPQRSTVDSVRKDR
jgi:hypothetical protein